MSYHDGHMGIELSNSAAVNPLVAIQRKLDKIKKLLSEPNQIQELSAIGLKNRIEQILNE
jgi:hypothetical protein|tara:strand:+ start:214 stop:393 length:180 start_codon:yes stop_codon:yes gene_type:complete